MKILILGQASKDRNSTIALHSIPELLFVAAAGDIIEDDSSDLDVLLKLLISVTMAAMLVVIRVVLITRSMGIFKRRAISAVVP